MHPIQARLLGWSLLVGLGLAGFSATVRASTNHWTVLHERDAAASEVRLRWVVRSGSLADPAGREGTSHFTARALLRGTTTRPRPDLDRAFRSISATVAVVPGRESTELNFRVPAARFDALLHLLRDVFSNPEFDPIEMDELRSELLNEDATLRGDAQRFATRVGLQQLFAGTSAANPPEGLEPALSRISSRDVREFFRLHFVRSNVVLALMTPFDSADVQSRVDRLLRGLPDGASVRHQMPSPIFRGVEAVVIPDSNAFGVHFQVLLPGVAAVDGDLPGLELANQAFGVGPDSRLALSAPQLNGWLTWASSGFQQLMPLPAGPGVFSIIGNATSEYVSDVIPTTLHLYRDFVSWGVSDFEFEQSRRELLDGMVAAWGSAQRRLALRLGAQLSNGIPRSPSSWQQEIAHWDARRVSSRLKARMMLDAVVIVAVGDPATLVPLLQSIPEVGSVRVVAR